MRCVRRRVGVEHAVPVRLELGLDLVLLRGHEGLRLVLERERTHRAQIEGAHQREVEPLGVEHQDVDVAAREKAIFIEQARESGKPENIIEKMVEGRMRKFYEEVVLLKQAFVMNPDLTVEKALAEAVKEIGAPAKLTGFVRFAVGEGVEKEETDFAAEVAAAAKG